MSRAISHLPWVPAQVSIVLAMAACAHPAVAPAPSPPPSSSPAAPAPPAPASPAPAADAAPAPPPPVLGYDKPPRNVLDVLHAPTPPQPLVSPTHDTILLVSWVEYPPISQVSEPFLRLAGVRVEPRTRRQHDTPGGYSIAPCARSLTLVDVATSRETPVALPAGGCADAVLWSADGKRFAFRNTSTDAVELWIGNPGDGTTHRLGNGRLNPMLGSSLQWLPDQKTLLVKLVPANAGPRPQAAAAVAEAPSTQEADGQSGESSTYEARDTLKDRHDEELFEYYGTSQLALVDSTTGATTPLGAPGVYAAVSSAPDGDHILVTEIKKPYSYLVAWSRFAHGISVWDRSGRAAPRRSHSSRSPIAYRSAAYRRDRAASRGVRPSPPR